MDDDPDTAWLRAQVDQAVGDVRRTESVAPAAVVGLLVSGVPMLIMLIVAVLRLL